MISQAQVLESDTLRRVQQAAEARGLKFYVNPPREVIPEFLENLQPDAIAVGPAGGVVFEVKRRGVPTSDEKQIAEIARRVSGQKGWELHAVYLGRAMDEMAPIAKPTPEQLQAALREVEALTRGGHLAAALVTGWAALESLARLASADDSVSERKGLLPIHTVQTLAEEGYIENDIADRLRDMAKLRNAVAHGDLSAHVAAEQVQYLLKQLQAIASEIMNVARQQAAPG